MGGEHRGVPYALTLGGELADPATAEPLTRGYRCLACDEFVHLKRGSVRVAHFAHYADREVACNPETVLHEAAKYRLKEMLLAGTRAFHLQVACPGYRTAYDTPVKCAGDNPAVVTLRAPAFDAAGVEVPFPPYRLDAAATLAGAVVLGLEVYQSHQVDEEKRVALARSGLPWLEVEARAVLEHRMPWRAISSSLGEKQCADCRRQAAEAERQRRELEARKRAQEERQQREAARQKMGTRVTHAAWDGHKIRTPSEKGVGAVLKCPACKENVTVQLVGGSRVFLHAESATCDPARAWVKGGMVAIHQQLTKDPKAVRVQRRCSLHELHNCKNTLTQRLPEFDAVHPADASLILVKDGALAGHISFARRDPDIGAPRRWWLRPINAIKHPATWWQRPDGNLCSDCQQRVAQARKATEESRRAARERREAVELLVAEQRTAEHLAREPEMLEVARKALEFFNIDPRWAADQGVVVRQCEYCIKRTAYIITSSLQAIPAHAESALVTVDHEIHCRCMHCGHPGSNNHDRFRPLGEDLAGYEIRPDAIRSLTTKPPRGN